MNALALPLVGMCPGVRLVTQEERDAMRVIRGRRVYGLAFGAVLVPLVAASMAYACSVLSTLAVEQGSGPVGQTITGTGRSFTRIEVGNVEQVKIRWGSVSGPVLYEARPDSGGNISFSFAVPDVAPGQYIILATQRNPDGTQVPGTPARASFQVTGPAAQPVADTEAVLEPSSPAPAAAAAVAPAPAAVRRPAAAPRVRVAPVATPAAAVAPVAAPAAVTPVPAPAAAPAPVVAPAVTPAPESAPATAPARRSVMVSMSDKSSGSPTLAIALVGVGLVLALGASAVVLAGRRDQKAAARAKR